MSKPFKFKQFTVQQDRCAMKIGTDGVLLGAWVSLQSSPHRILDIGAGTGVMALQLAQRSTADTVDAVEIDSDAYAIFYAKFLIPFLFVQMKASTPVTTYYRSRADMTM